jgi:hypothetical protein
MTDAEKWLSAQADAGYPLFSRGMIFLSMYHGNLISWAIAFFQKKGQEMWSHTGVYVGLGQTAEATTPKGGVFKLAQYFDARHTLALYEIPGMTLEQRAMFCSEAVRIAPRPYDYWQIVRHGIDNIIERLTWNGSSGFRPLAYLLKDANGSNRNVCSEMVERAFNFATGGRFQGGQVGEARPADVAGWLYIHGRQVVLQERGKVTYLDARAKT